MTNRFHKIIQKKTYFSYHSINVSCRECHQNYPSSSSAYNCLQASADVQTLLRYEWPLRKIQSAARGHSLILGILRNLVHGCHNSWCEYWWITPEQASQFACQLQSLAFTSRNRPKKFEFDVREVIFPSCCLIAFPMNFDEGIVAQWELFREGVELEQSLDDLSHYEFA